MPNDNDKIDINKHEVDIETLKKQNVNDLLSIKELYKKIEKFGEKISQIKYIDTTLINKIKKDYESLKKHIMNENIQIELNNKIEETKTLLQTDVTKINEQLDTKTKELENKKLDKDSVLTMANMGQDVKEAMTGGSVAVVGKNTVLTENIVNKQVTPDKTSFLDATYFINETLTTSITDRNSLFSSIGSYTVSPGRTLIMEVGTINIDVTPSYGWIEAIFRDSDNNNLGNISLNYKESNTSKKVIIPENTVKMELKYSYSWSSPVTTSVIYSNFKLYLDGCSLTKDISVPYIDEKLNVMKPLDVVYSLSNITSEHGYSASGGQDIPKITISENYRTTPLFPIDLFEFKNIEIYGKTWFSQIEYFDINQKKISGKSVSSDDTPLTSSDIVYPLGCVYIRLSYTILKQNKGYLILKYEKIKELKIKANDGFEKSKEYLKYYFNNALCIGDSLTYGCDGITGTGYTENNYPNFLSKMTGWNVENHGVSGATFISYWNNKIKTLNFQNTENVIIFLGTNGALTDTIDSDTVGNNYNDYSNTNTGCACKIIEYIKEQKPNINIFMCSMPYTYNNQDNINHNNVLKKIVEKYNNNNVFYLDIFNTFRVKNENLNMYAPADRVHFVGLGYLEFADAVLKCICDTLYNQPSKFIY